MAKRRADSYDWFEDPFDEGKVDPADRPATGSKSCLLIGLALVLFLVAVILIVVGLVSAVL